MPVRRLLACAAASALVGLLALPAAAIEKCKIKQRGRDGTILVSAKNVVGTPRYGFTADNVSGSFANLGECLAEGKARKCTLADEGAPERSTPPPFCAIHLADDEGSCEARLRGCTPGLRPICPPDMEQLGSTCIERSYSQAAEFGAASNACVARDRSLCSQGTYLACDAANFQNGRTGSCGWATDGGVPLWTLGSNSEDGQSAFARLVWYAPDNEVNEQTSDSGGMYYYFCCTALGGL